MISAFVRGTGPCAESAQVSWRPKTKEGRSLLQTRDKAAPASRAVKGRPTLGCCPGLVRHPNGVICTKKGGRDEFFIEVRHKEGLHRFDKLKGNEELAEKATNFTCAVDTKQNWLAR